MPRNGATPTISPIPALNEPYPQQRSPADLQGSSSIPLSYDITAPAVLCASIAVLNLHRSLSLPLPLAADEAGQQAPEVQSDAIACYLTTVQNLPKANFTRLRCISRFTTAKHFTLHLVYSQTRRTCPRFICLLRFSPAHGILIKTKSSRRNRLCRPFR